MRSYFYDETVESESLHSFVFFRRYYISQNRSTDNREEEKINFGG